MSEIHFQTSRLGLVPHVPAHLRALIRGNEEYARVSGMTPAEGLRGFIVSEDVSPAWRQKLESATAPDPWTFGFALLHLEDGLVIGNASFTAPPDAAGVVEIAYGIVPKYQGVGLATEAANALIAYAQESGRVRLVRAHTLPESNPSTRVLAKCGFRQVAELNDPVDGVIWRWEKKMFP